MVIIFFFFFSCKITINLYIWGNSIPFVPLLHNTSLCKYSVFPYFAFLLLFCSVASQEILGILETPIMNYMKTDEWRKMQILACHNGWWRAASHRKNDTSWIHGKTSNSPSLQDGYERQELRQWLTHLVKRHGLSNRCRQSCKQTGIDWHKDREGDRRGLRAGRQRAN